MRPVYRIFVILAYAILFGFSPLFAQVPVNLTPTTTVVKETVNNTSASGTYSNPSVGTTIGNVSKLPLSQLLPGFHGKIYASVVLFWGSGSGKQTPLREIVHQGDSAKAPPRNLIRVIDAIDEGTQRWGGHCHDIADGVSKALAGGEGSPARNPG